MEFHPSKIPISKTFDVKDEKQATEAAHEMVMIGFDKEDKGYKVLMSKENEKNCETDRIYSNNNSNLCTEKDKSGKRRSLLDISRR